MWHAPSHPYPSTSSRNNDTPAAVDVLIRHLGSRLNLETALFSATLVDPDRKRYRVVVQEAYPRGRRLEVDRGEGDYVTFHYRFHNGTLVQIVRSYYLGGPYDAPMIYTVHLDAPPGRLAVTRQGLKQKVPA